MAILYEAVGPPLPQVRLTVPETVAITPGQHRWAFIEGDHCRARPTIGRGDGSGPPWCVPELETLSWVGVHAEDAARPSGADSSETGVAVVGRDAAGSGSPADVFYGDDDGITVDDLEQDPVNADMDTPVLAPLHPLVRVAAQQVSGVDHLFRTLRVVLL